MITRLYLIVACLTGVNCLSLSPFGNDVARSSSTFVRSSEHLRNAKCHRKSNHHGASGRLHMSVPGPIETLTSGLASICRIPNGVTVDPTARRMILAEDEESNRPEIKRLYDIENSIACRKVRERLTELDLVVERVIPACTNSRVFLDPGFEFPIAPGTKIPTLVASTKSAGEDGKEKEIVLSGTDEILEFLNGNFVMPKPPAALEEVEDDDDVKKKVIGVLREAGAVAASLLRTGRGDSVKVVALMGSNAPRPKLPLILYSYEGNQFCRLVREVLTELDIVYELRSAGKESPRRLELSKITGGSSQCPYLIDPNTGTSLKESKDIILYLYKNYALFAPPNELLQWTSQNIMSLAKPIFSFLTPLQAGSTAEDKAEYKKEIEKALSDINEVTSENQVVIFTYGLSPFSSEALALLDRLEIEYKQVSLGAEWIPGLIKEGGSQMRAALLESTGQSSLPHIFIGGESIGGLFSGKPGLVPALEKGLFFDMLSKGKSPKSILIAQSVKESAESTESLATEAAEKANALAADVGTFE